MLHRREWCDGPWWAYGKGRAHTGFVSTTGKTGALLRSAHSNPAPPPVLSPAGGAAGAQYGRGVAIGSRRARSHQPRGGPGGGARRGRVPGSAYESASEIGQYRPSHWLHILLFSRRTTRVASRYTGGNTSHLGPFGPCRRPGPRCDPPPARARPAMHGKGDFAVCYYLFSAREGGRVLGAHRPGAEPMGRPLVTVRELGALGPSGVCQNGPTRTVLSAAQTTVPAVPRPIAVCTPLFSQGLDPLGVGHTGRYTGHLGLVGPDMGIGRCGDPPPPWALPTGAIRGILFVHFPRRPGGGLGSYRCGAEPMGSNLAAVRERGVLGLRGVHRIGSGATVPEVQKMAFILKDYYSDSDSVKGGLWTPIPTEQQA